MTTKDIIPDYLIYNIITPILDHLLLSNKDYNSDNRFKYLITLLNDFTKNEIIKLSLVSKNWFNKITTSISNNLTNDYNLHRWMNKECIDHITFSDYCDTFDSGGMKTVHIKVLKINTPFSIIKIDPRIINNYFKSKCQIIDDNYQFQLEDGDHLKSHEKTIFNIDTTQLLKNEMSPELSDILSGLNVNSSTTTDNCNLEFNLLNMKLESINHIDKIIGLVTNNNKRNNFIVNSIIIDGSGIIDNDIFKYIVGNLKPNKIKISPNGYDQDLKYHFNYSWLFNTCSNLESVIIKKDDHLEPSCFSELPLISTNLKSLSFSFLFHDMIKIIRQDNIEYNECYSEIESFNNPESIEQQFQIMIQQLSNNKTIKKLKVSNFCELGKSCTTLLNKPCTLHPISTINPTYCTLGVYCYTKRKENQIKLDQHAKTIINQGFSSIFKTNSTIEWFKISNLELIDESFFSGLIKNSTIKTLVIKSTYCENPNKVFDYLVSDVLTVNKSIKHLVIRHDIVSNVFKLLLKHQNEISLYSINLITTFNNINDLIKLIESSSTSIIEFNITFRNTDDDEDSTLSRDDFSKLLNKNTNNKIINIF